MAEAVVIDDGGSTRIQHLGLGKLDKLLEVTNVNGTNQSTDCAKGPFSQITVLCVNKTGTAAPPALGVFPIAMKRDDTFEIFSDQHRVFGKIVDRSANPPFTATDCEITVKAIGGIEPVVEAKQSKGQRRYIVSNAPAIDKVVINPAGPARASNFNIPNDTIYTVVVLI